MNIFKSKKFRQGTFATLLSILGVVVIILFASVFGTLADRFKWQLDMTEDQIFTITDDTKDFLQDLDKDVTIYVLNSEAGFTASSPTAYFTQANEMIQNYEDLSPHISVQYVDIVKDPTFVSKYTDQNLERNSLLLECGDNTFWVASQDLFNLQQTQQGQYVTSSKAEQVLTSAILNVTSDHRPIVTVIGGHDELSVTGFTDLLELNNYEITHTNLMTDDIDPETTIAIVAAPMRDFTEDELRKLDKFLLNDNQLGKTLFYAASYQQNPVEDYPNLNAFLAEWGLGVSDELIFELEQTRRFHPTNTYLYIVDYVDNDFQPEQTASEYYNAMMYPHAVEILFESGSGRQTASLLETSDLSGAFPRDASEDWQPGEEDLNGPYSTLALSQWLKYDGTTPIKSNVVVLGSADAIAESSLAEFNFANSKYFVSLMDEFSQRDSSVYIESKRVANYRMDISVKQQRTLGIVFAIVLPVLLVASGLTIWLRRRHR